VQPRLGDPSGSSCSRSQIYYEEARLLVAKQLMILTLPRQLRMYVTVLEGIAQAVIVLWQ